ncbi:MAG: ABC transporter substrate-binding protein, partial [Candidatus Dormibacteraeota bacterium]|nr:ABC transporter substrate-binding protein [Candidatus Dormibacteraeota bacterium]
GADISQQKQIVQQLSAVMDQDVPLVPVTEGVDWYQYDTTDFGGWPTAQDPYAQPPVWAYPDNGVVLTHLYPLSS